MTTTATAVAGAAAVLALVWPLVQRVYDPDPLDDLPGPNRDSFWSGASPFFCFVSLNII